MAIGALILLALVLYQAPELIARARTVLGREGRIAATSGEAAA
jgi:hypothetical protein